MVNASGAQAALGDFKTATLAQQDVADRHAHVLQHHFHVAVRRVVISKHGQRPQHADTGCVARHQHHRLLGVACSVGVGLAHDDENLAARRARARAVPLAAIDDVFVAFAPDTALDVGGIRGGHGGLGHQEGRADLAVEQGL